MSTVIHKMSKLRMVLMGTTAMAFVLSVHDQHTMAANQHYRDPDKWGAAGTCDVCGLHWPINNMHRRQSLLVCDRAYCHHVSTRLGVTLHHRDGIFNGLKLMFEAERWETSDVARVML